jgi:hypothetical protein
MTQKSDPAARLVTLSRQFSRHVKLAQRVQRKTSEMVVVGRVLLWTVVLVAPGGFLLVPVLALGRAGRGAPAPLRQLGERLSAVKARLQRYWTKS